MTCFMSYVLLDIFFAQLKTWLWLGGPKHPKVLIPFHCRLKIWLVPHSCSNFLFVFRCHMVSVVPKLLGAKMGDHFLFVTPPKKITFPARASSSPPGSGTWGRWRLFWWVFLCKDIARTGTCTVSIYIYIYSAYIMLYIIYKYINIEIKD